MEQQTRTFFQNRNESLYEFTDYGPPIPFLVRLVFSESNEFNDLDFKDPSTL
ncbi:hypothetical protein JWG45_00955 [Leptospira sp. 201903070]|uniref:Uncharacterized protein n=1 Tax=Leptospira ainlahdjerensis TaxID=2810033 RepID=A0ABS2U5Q4_9LEPT|nr:hypothetical protein [Leptospira ainlahdjerensis]MBM9575710.1 hypothetical protein [Leptospira ainlahdjerensis]